MPEPPAADDAARGAVDKSVYRVTSHDSLEHGQVLQPEQLIDMEYPPEEEEEEDALHGGKDWAQVLRSAFDALAVDGAVTVQQLQSVLQVGPPCAAAGAPPGAPQGCVRTAVRRSRRGGCPPPPLPPLPMFEADS